MTNSVTILGAGIAGLSAAFRLKNAGVQYKLYEQNKRAGGLLDNFTVDGFRFDQAVHLSFATEGEVRKVFDKTDYYAHHPESRCFDEKRWIRHPIQNNLFPLPTPEKVELIKGFVERPDIEIQNYADWLDYQYGYKIAERYPRRYTRKYWDFFPEDLGVDWIGNRMHRATLEEVLSGAFTDDVPNYYYAKEMRYPKKGGYVSFISPLLREVKVDMEKKLSKIDLSKKVLYFEDGTFDHYENIINTIPLPEFVNKIKDCPEAIVGLADSLRWTRVYLVSIGFCKPDLIKDLWCYIYASRFYSPCLKSFDNCPSGCSSIQFEIYENSAVKKGYANDELIQNCVYALEKMDLAVADDIIVTDVRVVEYGNVVFYKGMESVRDQIKEWLDSRGVALAGRFGEWDYLWSNQAMMSGFNRVAKYL